MTCSVQEIPEKDALKAGRRIAITYQSMHSQYMYITNESDFIAKSVA